MKKAPERFKWKTDGTANKRAVFTGPFYRFTFLTDRLVRIEYDPSGTFEDRASQSVFYRNLPVPDFMTTVDEKNVLRVETDHIIFSYEEKAEFAPDTLSVKLKSAPGTVWHYGDNIEQLGGTACTLDGADGKIPLTGGVVSRNGIAVFDDSDSLVLGEDGWVETRLEGTKDIYVFAYGHDYKAAVRDLYKITGAPPMLPDYALGNWWSRYHRYTQEEYQDLMLRFERENIPFSVAVVDMDWHYVNEIPEDVKAQPYSQSPGWTGYTWNPELFPDYRAFLTFLADHNLKTALNLHPADGCRKHEIMYPKMAEALGLDASAGEKIKFDILDPDFMEKYFDILHHPYEDEGVNFWWMDWQQGKDYHWIHEPNRDGKLADPREKLDPLWMLNHLHILDISRNGKRPMFFSRYAGLGSHRYPVGFSGDTIITWKSLAFQPYFTANASNAGYGWWSHDIGGHMCGLRDDELTVRWMQLGVFSPINRLHSSSNPFSGKEPWNLAPYPCSVAKDWLRLRHQLFPYIYTMNYRCHNGLEPLVQPMYYEYPECSEAYASPDQFFFGSELMVAPIVEKNDPVDLLGKADVWFPEGDWFDIFTGDRYAGGRRMNVYRDLSGYPVFAKAGAILPLDKAYADNKLANREELDIHVFPGADNSFTLYQDEGEGSRFEEGHFATTKFSLKWGEKKIFTVESSEGDLKVIPKKRTLNVMFRAMEKEPELRVTVNGKQAKYTCVFDKEAHTATVTLMLKSVETAAIEILDGDPVYRNTDAAKRAFEILMHSQISYQTKATVWDRIEKGQLGYTLLGILAEPAEQHMLDALREVFDLMYFFR